jgi:transcription factor E2F3
VKTITYWLLMQEVYLVLLFMQEEIEKLTMEEHKLDDQIRLHG